MWSSWMMRFAISGLWYSTDTTPMPSLIRGGCVRPARGAAARDTIRKRATSRTMTGVDEPGREDAMLIVDAQVHIWSQGTPSGSIGRSRATAPRTA